jgi:hypothetical protein
MYVHLVLYNSKPYYCPAVLKFDNLTD